MVGSSWRDPPKLRHAWRRVAWRVAARTSWSEATPIALSTITIGTSSAIVLCRSANLPCFETMCVLLLRSCVEDVTAEWMLPLASVSTMIPASRRACRDEVRTANAWAAGACGSVASAA